MEEVLSDCLQAKQDIAEFLHRNRQYLEFSKEARCVAENDLLFLAKRISHTIRAPVQWLPGAPLVCGHSPFCDISELSGGCLRKFQMNINSVDKQRNYYVQRETKGTIVRRLDNRRKSDILRYAKIDNCEQTPKNDSDSHFPRVQRRHANIDFEDEED